MKKNVIRRTFKSKKNPEAPQRNKAPKIQRLVTDERLRRKRVITAVAKNRWNKTQAATQEYEKLYDEWMKKKKNALHEARKAEKAAQ